MTSSELSLTCSLVHRQLIGQDAANLAEGGHLDAVLLQLALHVVDLLLCERRRARRNKLAVAQVTSERVEWSGDSQLTREIDFSVQILDLRCQTQLEQIEAAV